MPIFVNFGTISGEKTGNGQVHGLNLGMKALTPNTVRFIQSPRDVSTGQSVGRRKWEPLKIIKEIGSSKPLFFTLGRNKVLPTLHLNFEKPDSAGKLVTYFTITLSDATVGSIVRKPAPSFSKRSIAADTHELEEIEFTFRKIEYKYSSGKTSHSDDWMT